VACHGGRTRTNALWLTVVAGALALAVISLTATAQAQAPSPAIAEVGHPPPLFTLPDEHGEMHALGDLMGRPVILYFTHNQCHYCSQVIAFLKRAHTRYEDTDLTIVTLNVWADDGIFIRRYKEAFGLPFDMLAGKDLGLLRSYEVNYVPIIVFIGRDGLIRQIYHHYVLPDDFDASTAEIVDMQ
jgi:peroxiredoxin